MSDPIEVALAEAGLVRDALHNALDSIDRIRARATSADGTVQAEVDGDGALRELLLPESLAKLSDVDLGNSIVEAAAAAATDAQGKRRKIVESMQISSTYLR